MSIIANFLKQFGYRKEIWRNPATGLPYSNSDERKLTAAENSDLIASEIWIYSCINLIATTIAGLPIRIYKPIKKNGKTEYQYIENHPFLKLLKQPNSYFNQFDLIYHLQANKDLTGNGYLLLDEKVKANGIPTKLYSLIAPAIKIEYDKKTGEPIKYVNIGVKITDANGTTKDLIYELDQIIHSRYIDPRGYCNGLSPLEAATMTILTLKSSRKTNYGIFKNGARLDGFYKTAQKLNDEQYKRLKTELRQKYRGDNNAHQSPLLTDGVEYQIVNANLRDLEFIAGHKLSKEELCSIFSIPVILLNSTESSTYNNLVEATKQAYTQCYIPRINNLTSCLQKILDQYNDGTFIQFDLTNVQALRDDLNKTADAYVKFVNNGISVNDAINFLDLPFPPQPGGDVPRIPFSLTPMDAPNQIPEITPPTEPIKTIKTIKLNITPEIKEKKVKLFMANTSDLETKYKKELVKYFKRQEQIVDDKLSKYKSISVQTVQNKYLILTAKTETETKAIDIETILFDDTEQIRQLINTSLPIHTESINRTGTAEMEFLNLGISFDIANPRVIAFLKKYGLTKAKSVIETAKQGLRDTMISGIDAGESIDQLRRRMSDYYATYEDIEQYKLQRISQTEVVGASNEGALESYRQGNVSGKSWLSTPGQPHPRENHIAMENKYSAGISVDEDFVDDETGESAPCPGQFGDPANDCNCHCTISPVIL